MKITVLTFHPETLHIAEQRLSVLLPGETLDLNYVYAKVQFSPEDVWDEDTYREVEKRFEGLPQNIRLIHCEPSQFIEQLLGTDPPAQVVVAYNHWSEQVSMTAAMLAVRNFPTLLLGYRL